MKIAIDFDGTIVDHAYPDIGAPVPGAIECMLELHRRGAKLILFTMRSERSLDEAVRYLESNGIKLYGVNIDPDQLTWTSSPKPYAVCYVDDAGIGCPLIENKRVGGRPMVDWSVVEPTLFKLLDAWKIERDIK